jgi:hypothetical protein
MRSQRQRSSIAALAAMIVSVASNGSDVTYTSCAALPLHRKRSVAPTPPVTVARSVALRSRMRRRP